MVEVLSRLLKGVVGGGTFLLLLAEVSPLPSSLRVAQAFDPVAGQKVFIRCKTCHTIEKKGVHLIGPNLWGIVGKKSATTEGFQYSEAMKKFGKKWDVATLDAYLKKPSAVVPGSRMLFVGLSDTKQRADVIAYLNSKSDKPIRLSVAKKDNKKKDSKKKDSKKKTSDKKGASSGARVAAKSSLLPAGVGRDETEAYCSVCHSLSLVVQQGLNRADWDELLDWMVEEQEMQPIAATDRTKVLGYLAKHFNRDRPNLKK